MNDTPFLTNMKKPPKNPLSASNLPTENLKPTDDKQFALREMANKHPIYNTPTNHKKKRAINQSTNVSDQNPKLFVKTQKKSAKFNFCGFLVFSVFHVEH